MTSSKTTETNNPTLCSIFLLLAPLLFYRLPSSLWIPSFTFFSIAHPSLLYCSSPHYGSHCLFTPTHHTSAPLVLWFTPIFSPLFYLLNTQQKDAIMNLIQRHQNNGKLQNRLKKHKKVLIPNESFHDVNCETPFAFTDDTNYTLKFTKGDTFERFIWIEIQSIEKIQVSSCLYRPTVAGILQAETCLSVLQHSNAKAFGFRNSLIRHQSVAALWNFQNCLYIILHNNFQRIKLSEQRNFHIIFQKRTL